MERGREHDGLVLGHRDKDPLSATHYVPINPPASDKLVAPATTFALSTRVTMSAATPYASAIALVNAAAAPALPPDLSPSLAAAGLRESDTLPGHSQRIVWQYFCSSLSGGLE